MAKKEATKKILLKPEFKNTSIQVMGIDGKFTATTSTQLARNPMKYIKLGYGAYYDMPIEDAVKIARDYKENVVDIHRAKNPEVLAAKLKNKENEAAWKEEKAQLMSDIAKSKEAEMNALLKLKELEKKNSDAAGQKVTPPKVNKVEKANKVKEAKKATGDAKKEGDKTGKNDLPWNGEGEKPEDKK